MECIDHIEVYVKDKDKAASWYKKVFGFVPIKEYEEWTRNNGPLFIGNKKEFTIKLALISGTRDTDGSINRIAFGTSGRGFVDFINKMNSIVLYRTDRNNSRVKVTSNDIVDHQLSYSVYFDDEDGNKLEVTCYDYNYIKSNNT